MKEEKEDKLTKREERRSEPIDKDWQFGVTPEEAKAKLQAIKLFQVVVKEQLQEGHDFGTIPGTKKPTLLKPGAEKITKLLNCFDDYEEMDSVERWGDKDAFFHYKVKCTLSDIATGLRISSGVGSCNSKESKYRYRWIPIWDLTAAQAAVKEDMPKKEMGKKGKKKYWFYRFENDDPFSQVNTILKMASKRAHIAAALSAGRLSELFSQDLEDTPIAKEPEEQISEPTTKEQTHTIAKLENILVDKFGLMPEVMQQRFRTEFGASKEIKDLTHLEAVEWMDMLKSRIDREKKKAKAAKEAKGKRTAEKEAETKTDLAPYKKELSFVLKQHHEFGGKNLTQRESDELDGAETLADYEALLKKWKVRREEVAPPEQKAAK